MAERAASGLTNREIAQGLFLSLRTVESHLTSAYRKLQIESRANLADALFGNPGSSQPTPGGWHTHVQQDAGG